MSEYRPHIGPLEPAREDEILRRLLARPLRKELERRLDRYAALLRDCLPVVACLSVPEETAMEREALARRIRAALAEESGEQPKGAADER